MRIEGVVGRRGEVLGDLERPLGCLIEARLGRERLRRVLNAKLTLDSVLRINGFHT